MDFMTEIEGKRSRRRAARWERLQSLVGQLESEDFYWEGEVKLANDDVLYAFKHSLSNVELILGEDGGAYVEIEDGRFRRVPAYRMANCALAGVRLSALERRERWNRYGSSAYLNDIPF